LVSEISAACREQDTGTEQINQAIQQLDKVTQQNAGASEEMSATSEELAAQAEQLQAAIGFFRTEDQTSAAPEAQVAPPARARATATPPTRPSAPHRAVPPPSPGRFNGHAITQHPDHMSLDLAGGDDEGRDKEFVRY
jgi:methyl-accepting chemotaxis protein